MREEGRERMDEWAGGRVVVEEEGKDRERVCVKEGKREKRGGHGGGR